MSARGIGLYLGVVQFFFAACWIVYVLYLPQLAAAAGIERRWVAWILMADQLVFVFADYACGVAADRMSRVVGRVGLWVLGATLVSAAAFLALPFVAPGGSPALFIACTLLWAVTSSALRAPPLALVGRHAAKSAQPLLVALTLLGVGVASASAPYLGLLLKGVDPRWPFALSSLALALMTLGLVAAERRLAAPARRAAAGAPAATPSPAANAGDPAVATGRGPVFLAAALLAALAFQAHVFIDSAPLYLRFVAPTDLPGLLPVFWIGFNVGIVPLSFLVKRWPLARTMAASAVVAAVAAAVATLAPSLPVLVAAQALAGVGWAGAIVTAFAWALALGRRAGTDEAGRGAGFALGPGAWAGAISSVLALTTLARMASVAAGWPKAPGFGDALVWWPVVGWLAASVAVAALAVRRRTRLARTSAR